MTGRAIVLLAILLLVGCEPPEPEPVVSDARGAISQDLVYGRKHGLALTLNVYQPTAPNGAGVIFYNSSGWTSPFVDFVRPDSEPPTLRSTAELRDIHPAIEEFSPHYLMDAGYTVFEVRHSSSPRFNIPEIVSDVAQAVHFVRLQGARFGVDPDRLGVWGGSAGGYLALMSGLSDTAIADQAPAPSGVAAIVAYFPVSDLDQWVDEDPSRAGQFPSLDFPRGQYATLSPVSHASQGDPPTLVVHGDQDALVPLAQGALIVDALDQVGVNSDLRIIEGAEHGFVGPEAVKAIEAAIEWFDRHLLGT